MFLVHFRCLFLFSFEDLIRDHDVRLFVDNDSASSAILRGFSSCGDICGLSFTAWLQAADLRIGMWVDRVASDANIADLPTRPEKEPLWARIRRELSIRWVPPPRERFAVECSRAAWLFR